MMHVLNVLCCRTGRRRSTWASIANLRRARRQVRARSGLRLDVAVPFEQSLAIGW